MTTRPVLPNSGVRAELLHALDTNGDGELSTLALARRLQLSIATVTRALEQLERSGHASRTLSTDGLEQFWRSVRT